MNTTSLESNHPLSTDQAKIPSGLLARLGSLLDEACAHLTDPSELVERCAPELYRLMQEHPQDVNELVNQLRWPEVGASSYTRQRIHESESGAWSIYGICWLPGQYTPVHDHGTWGVVGVLQGCLYEHSMALVEERRAENHYRLAPAGVCLLSKGAINTFVPEPDHIHRSGVPASAHPTASIHLYGRVMTHYHAYDLNAHSRSRLDVE